MALSLLDKISARVSELTKSERKIAAAVLDDPAQTVNENIAQLAKRAGVSEPTVYRFCKTFGTDGFPSFKIALSAELSSGRFSTRQSVSSGDSIEKLTEKVFGSTVSALNDLERSLDHSVLARCIDLIALSRRVVVLADGLSESAGHYFFSRMLFMGLPCELITDSSLGAMAAAAMRSSELLIAISSTGQNKHMVQATYAARRGEASVIAICPKDSDLSKTDALNLYCPKASAVSTDLQTGRVALLGLLELLLSCVMLRRSESLRDLQERLASARERCYLKTDAELQAQKEAEAAAKAEAERKAQASKEISAGAPITPINWPF